MWVWQCITSGLDKDQDILPNVICCRLKWEVVVGHKTGRLVQKGDAVYVSVNVAIINQNKLKRTKKEKLIQR